MKQQSPEGPTFGLRSARATLAHEWFAPAVAVLAVMYVVITVQAWMAASELPDRLATTLFFVGCTGALVVGLHLRRVTATSDTTGPAPPLRSGRRLLGDGLLIVGTAPSFAFYWAIVPLMLGIVVIAGVLSQRAPEHSDALVHGEPR